MVNDLNAPPNYFLITMAAHKSTIIALVLSALLVSAALLVLSFSPQLGQVASQTTEQELIDQLWKEGESWDLFGPLNYSDGEAVGKYIQFNYLEDDGVMSDVRVNTTNGSVPVLESLAVTGLGSTEPEVIGPLFQIYGPQATLLVHNNPTALIQVGASGAGEEVVLTLPDDAEVTRNNQTQAPSYNISVNGVQLWLGASNADVQVAGNEVNVSFNDAGAVLIRQLPQFESVGTAEEREIMAAIDRGLVGSEMWLLARSTGYVQEFATLTGVETNVTSAEVDEIALEASAPFEGSSILIVNADTFTIDPDDDVTVTVDGETVPAADLTGVLESASSGDETPSYAMLTGERTSKFLIYLPDLTTSTEVVIASD